MSSRKRLGQALLCLVLGASCLVLGASVAGAQPAPWQPERLTPGWTFTPALGFGGLWDSNSTLRVTGDPLIGQWVGIVNPRGELDFNGRRTRFTAGYSGSLEAYQELAELTRYDQRGRVIARFQSTPRLQFTGTAGLSVSPTTERIDLAGLPFENVGTTQFTTRAGANYAVTQRTTFAAEYDFQLVEFDNTDTFSPTVLSGGHGHGGTATLRHAINSRVETGGAYSYRIAFTGADRQRVNIHDAMAIVQVRLAENTSFNGGAGIARLDLRETGESRTGPSLRASISHGLQRARVELAYDRSYIPSWSFGGTTTNEQIRGSVSVPLMSGRMSVAADIAFRHNEPLLSQPNPLVLDSWSTGGNISYAIARWIRVEGFYSASFQDSSARGEVDRTRVGVQFITFKPVRIE
ncbi:MAG: hypothetical protein AB7P99_05960 [Vicinamibacterales bacterium]